MGGSSYINVVPAAAQSSVTAIDCGDDRFCLALTGAGQVVAWGQFNNQGEITVPAAAQSGVVAISAGYQHSLALKDTGQVIAWGQNASGQCTVPVAAQSGIVAVAAGTIHSLALTSGGQVIAWGSNAFDTLAVPAAAQSGVTAISAGIHRSYALKSNGDVVMWGQTPPPGPSNVSALSADWGYAIALTNGGEAIPFGDLQTPELATPPLWAQGRIMAVSAARWNAAAIVHTCADIDECADGTAICGPNMTCVNTPGSYACECDPGYVLLGTTCTFSCAAAGNGAACDDGNACTSGDLCNGGACIGVLLACPATDSCHFPGKCNPATGACINPVAPNGYECDDGDLCTTSDACVGGECAGIAVECEAQGQCFVPGACDPGTGECSNPFAPVGTTCSDGAACTEMDTCALGTCVSGPCGDAWSCESGSTGITCTCAPGNAGPDCLSCAAGYESIDGVVAWGAPYATFAPPVGTDDDMVAIAGGYSHSLALTDAGQVIAWGSNLYGECSVPLQAQAGITAISAGAGFSLALTASGQVVAWGRGDNGQTTIPSAAQSGVVAIAAGWAHGLALTSTGQVVAWGQSGLGQTTVPAAAQSGIVAIAAGMGHSMALTANGQVIVWGWNGYGLTSPPAATQSAIVAIAAGGNHALALTAGGGVIGWGESNGATIPTQASAGIGAVAGGVDYSLGLTTGGHVLPWGFTLFMSSPPTQGHVTAIAAGGAHGLAIVHSCLLTNPCAGTFGGPCDDGDPCTTNDTCQKGQCGGLPVLCLDDADPCTAGAKCNPETGACEFAPSPTGTPCNDGNPCTDDACDGGKCIGVPLACLAPDQCHEKGTCTQKTGKCVYGILPDSTPCDDGDPCTKGDACKTGVCAKGADICPN